MRSHRVPAVLTVQEGSSEGSPISELEHEEGGREAEGPIIAVRRVRDGIAEGKYDTSADQLLADLHDACQRASQALESQQVDERQASLVIAELQQCAPS
jgi:hypothetical protein